MSFRSQPTYSSLISNVYPPQIFPYSLYMPSLFLIIWLIPIGILIPRLEHSYLKNCMQLTVLLIILILTFCTLWIATNTMTRSSWNVRLNQWVNQNNKPQDADLKIIITINTTVVSVVIRVEEWRWRNQVEVCFSLQYFLYFDL